MCRANGSKHNNTTAAAHRHRRTGAVQYERFANGAPARDSPGDDVCCCVRRRVFFTPSAQLLPTAGRDGTRCACARPGRALSTSTFRRSRLHKTRPPPRRTDAERSTQRRRMDGFFFFFLFFARDFYLHVRRRLSSRRCGFESPPGRRRRHRQIYFFARSRGPPGNARTVSLHIIM